MYMFNHQKHTGDLLKMGGGSSKGEIFFAHLFLQNVLYSQLFSDSKSLQMKFINKLLATTDGNRSNFQHR
jgi:hypothetical protein